MINGNSELNSWFVYINFIDNVKFHRNIPNSKVVQFFLTFIVVERKHVSSFSFSEMFIVISHRNRTIAIYQLFIHIYACNVVSVATVAVSVLIGLLHLVTQYTGATKESWERERKEHVVLVYMYVFKNEYRDERVFFSSINWFC